jgi:hypothetical protein
VAVTGLLPPASLLAATVKAAAAVPPEPAEPASVAVPNAIFPAENVTLPAGAALPLAAFTVAVS